MSFDAETSPAAEVLLVEDDEELRTEMAAYLDGAGYAVHQAGDVPTARRLLKTRPIQVAVLDVNLPGEDGLSLCRALADDGGPAILMLTAQGESIDRILGLELGADDYVVKPITPRELLARIKALLRRNPGVSGVERRTAPEATRPDMARPDRFPERAEGARPDVNRPPGDGPRPGAGPGAPDRAQRQRLPVRVAPRNPLEAAIFSREVEIGPIPQPVETRPRAQAQAPEPAAAPREPTRIILTPPAAQVAEAPVIEAPAAPPPQAPAAAPAPQPVERALPQPAAPSVFGLARAPYVEGEFVAALKTPTGWVTVKPQPEGFPNSWQRRVLIWFGLSFGLVAPVGYLLARRLAAPLGRFAAAAERLGREPAADLAPLAGPAEVGRAARAFNVMQQRLKRYVEDRTGMVGAISHDLRTPLARMRFKLERAPPALRAALGRDITQMEEMITSVLSFMRDESVAARRHSVDLRSILECVVDDAGDGAELAPGPPVAVTVDVLGVQRVFENLVDNALKYGTVARVALRVEAGEAVVEVADDGPGLAPEDLEQVFKPFYRSQEAKTSGKAGMGLGLAVSRSTVRAHGGELVLRQGADGLVAQVRLPAATAAAARAQIAA